MRQALILDVAKEAVISLSHHFDVEIAALCTNGRNKKAALQWPEARSMAAQGRSCRSGQRCICVGRAIRRGCFGLLAVI